MLLCQAITHRILPSSDMPLPPSSSNAYILNVPMTIPITAYLDLLQRFDKQVLQWDTPSNGLIDWLW